MLKILDVNNEEAKTIDKIGTQKTMNNYKGIPYVFEVTDYSIRVYGDDTYALRDKLKYNEFRWDSLSKSWTRGCDSQETANELYKMFGKISTIVFEIKPNYREVRKEGK